MKPFFRISLILLTASMVSLYACATSSVLTDEWKDNHYLSGPPKKILVVGVNASDAGRKLFEEEFTSELKRAGGNAVACHEVVTWDQKLTKELVKQAAKDNKADAVLVASLVGSKDVGYFRPPTPGPDGMGALTSFNSYYARANGLSTSPGYYGTESIVVIDVKLFNMYTEQPIWSARSTTTSPKDSQDLVDAFSQSVIQAMQADDLL